MLTHQSTSNQELEKLQSGLGALATTPDGTTMLTATSSSGAQLRSSKRGRWEMKRYPEEPLVLLGKQKINLQAHPQGSGLTYLPLPLEGRGVQAATTHPRRKTFPVFHMHALLQPWKMLYPCSLLESTPCFSSCHGATRGHQTSPPALGESPPRSPACSFWGWTTPSRSLHSPSPGAVSLPEPRKGRGIHV